MTEAAATAATKAEKVIKTVTMDDGQIVEFAGKKRMVKTDQTEGSTVRYRLDFLNGEVRICTLPEGLLRQAAAHGLAQKLGDEIAGIVETEDAVLAVTELLDRLHAGDWNAPRAEGMSGTSMLAKALAEVKGVDIVKVQAFLKTKDGKQKAAMRANPMVKAVIDRLEAEKVAKAGGSAIDTEALLGELSA